MQVCVCMRPAQLLAIKGGGGKRGNLSQVLLLKHASPMGKLIHVQLFSLYFI